MRVNQGHLTDFIKTLKFQEFKSANTLQAYNRDINGLFQFCQNELNEKAIFAYIDYLVNEKYVAPRSQARIISAIKKFCLFLVQKNYAQTNFSSNLELPKRPKDLPKAVNHQILEQIINSKPSNHQQKLAKTILIVFYATGLRISELLNLTVSDLEENQGKALKVKGKGNKVRLVPLGEIAAEVLANHLNNLKNDERYKKADLHFVFPSSKVGKNGKYGAISRQYVYKIIHNLGAEFGLDLSPHKLRHSFATELVKNKADLRTVQLMLGHSDLATTQIYTKIADEQAYNSLLSNHPLVKKS